MNDIFQEASEAEEVQYEGLTTPGTVFTSPWIDTNRSSDSCFVDTVIQRALPTVNEIKYLDSTSTDAMNRAMSPADKVDSWFASTPAGPSISSTSCLNITDTALTSLAGDSNQFWNQNVGDESFDPTPVSPSMHDLFTDSFFDEQDQPLNRQINATTGLSGSLAAPQSKPLPSPLSTRDPFFDSVPKGPSQLSTSRWNAGAPAFEPWTSTGGEIPAPHMNKTETQLGPVEPVRGNLRPLLSLRIPNASIGSDSFQSAPPMATYSEISDSRADAPHTTGTLVPAARPFSPSFQDPKGQTRMGDILDPTARPFQSKSLGQPAIAHRNHDTAMKSRAASYTNSRTWTSNLVMEKERWQRVEDSLGRMNLLKSSVVPKTLMDWLVHQRDRTDAKREREQRKLEDKNLSLRDLRLPPPGRPVKVGPAFRGRAFEHKNYGSVLVFPSVWAHMYEAPTERPDPLWPCVEEMKEEGDERNTSGFRRFPALPRVPGNDTVQYKLKAIQPFLPFDTIWELPTKERVKSANEKYSPEETEKMEGYLGRSLVDALDCITEDSF